MASMVTYGFARWRPVGPQSAKVPSLATTATVRAVRASTGKPPPGSCLPARRVRASAQRGSWTRSELGHHHQRGQHDRTGSATGSTVGHGPTWADRCPVVAPPQQPALQQELAGAIDSAADRRSSTPGLGVTGETAQRQQGLLHRRRGRRRSSSRRRATASRPAATPARRPDRQPGRARAGTTAPGPPWTRTAAPGSPTWEHLVRRRLQVPGCE